MDGWMTDREAGRQTYRQTDIHTNTNSMPESTLYGQTVTVTYSDLLIGSEALDYPLHIQTRSFSHQGLKQDKSMNINTYQSIPNLCFHLFSSMIKSFEIPENKFPSFPPKTFKKKFLVPETLYKVTQPKLESFNGLVLLSPYEGNTCFLWGVSSCK